MLYSLILGIRHLFYDKSWVKSFPTRINSVCVGNVCLGGAGKTPMTELIIRTIEKGDVESADAEIYGFEEGPCTPAKLEIAVVSRGYRRKSKGFQTVKVGDTSDLTGDEPLQIKTKFPFVNVVVDRDRVEACDFLAHPEKVPGEKFCVPDIIILDDAFQYRRLRPTKSMILTRFDRPYFKDHLIPWGRLRDLRSRVRKADMVVVTDSPIYLDDARKSQWAVSMGLSEFNADTCEGVNSDGRRQYLLFATTIYESLLPVFPEGDIHYAHAKRAVLFTGIANDAPLLTWLGETYRIVDHKKYPDHHMFTRADISELEASARRNSTSILVTTEKDAQRLRSIGDRGQKISDDMRRRCFYAPIHTQMLSAKEQNCLKSFLGLN